MRGATLTAIEVTLRLQDRPGTVNGIAWELQADERAVRRAIYQLRDMKRVVPDGHEPVGNNGALRAVVWKWKEKQHEEVRSEP